MMRYHVVAMNEPWNEGNGWDECPDGADGALYYVEEEGSGGPALSDGQPTREMAEAVMLSMIERDRVRRTREDEDHYRNLGGGER